MINYLMSSLPISDNYHGKCTINTFTFKHQIMNYMITMKIIVVFFTTFLFTEIEGHASRRYKAQVGQYYAPSAWNRIHEVSSVAECGNLCTLWDSQNIMCPLFQTIEGLYQKDTIGEDFRGYKCYLLLEDIE